MNFDLQKAVDTIISSKNFLKLKNVTEDSAYHDHEPVFDHLLKTYEIAKREIKGDFITNPKAKEKFNTYINKEIGGIKKRDLMIILALIHDIGKMLIFEDYGEKASINSIISDGTTRAYGHEYWGSLIVKEVLKDLSLPREVLDDLTNGVRLHGVFNDTWQQNRQLNTNELMDLVKRYAENIHIDEVFNAYCDCFSAPPFQEAKPLIIELFNNPNFYSQLKYSIMD